MIRGVVTASSEAMIRLRVRGPSGSELEVDAVVDPGFSSTLTLPGPTVAALGLSTRSAGTATLAAGTYRKLIANTVEV